MTVQEMHVTRCVAVQQREGDCPIDSHTRVIIRNITTEKQSVVDGALSRAFDRAVDNGTASLIGREMSNDLSESWID
jgi:hypothetical protein